MKFKKKPVEIEAIQFTNTEKGINHLYNFLKNGYKDYEYDVNKYLFNSLIKYELIHNSDWVVKNSKGQFSIRTLESFKKEYERI